MSDKSDPPPATQGSSSSSPSSSSSSTTKEDLTLEKGYSHHEVPVLQRHLLTPLLSKKIPPVSDDKVPWPRTPKKIIQYIFFWWMIPLMKIGYKRTLQNEDLWQLDHKMTVEQLYSKFKGHLDRAVAKNRAKALAANPDLTEDELREAGFSTWTIHWALFLTLRFRYIQGLLFKALFDISSTLTPLLTKALINFVETKTLFPSTPVNKGIGYAIGTAFIVLFSGVCINHFFHNSMTCGVQVKSILTKLLLEKSFKLDGKSRQKFSTGKITSMMGTDLARIDFAVGFQPFLIGFPIPVIIVVVLLIVNIGVSALVGIAIFLIAGALIGAGSKKLVGFRKSAAKFTDNRVSLVREVLSSIKMIKYYGWEIPYYNNIKEIRKNEMNFVFRLQFVRVIFTAVAVCLPTICSMVSFLVLHAIKPKMSPGDIFASLSLFSSLSQQVMFVPMALATSIDAHLSLKRVTELMKCDEEKPLDKAEEEHDRLESGLVLDREQYAVQMKNAEFKWAAVIKDDDEKDATDDKNKKNSNSELSQSVTNNHDQLSRTLTSKSGITVEVPVVDPSSFTGLHDIDLSIKHGEFIIVTGPIGSGKSSLLSAIARFMPKQSGALEINDSLLLCGYPWVQNATVKDNIVFGLPYDEARYKKVIHVCSLEADLAILPGGDETEVGERGITLSGGQKARINLARAVYGDKNIVLLDDVLSAVDAKVGRHIMEKCIMEFLGDKTRVLATHQLSLVNYADRVVYLDGSGRIDVGTVEELRARCEGFQKLMEFSAATEEDEQDDQANIDIDNKDEEEVIGQTNEASEKSEESYNYQHKNGDGKLIKEEDRAVNRISFQVYKNYLRLGLGRFAIPLLILFFLIAASATFCQIFTNTWLSFWTDQKFKGKHSNWYIGLYVMFCLMSVILVLLEFSFICYVANKCARELNIKALRNVLYTPMSFLDTTPMGRILNRFTKDTDSLDNEIGDQLRIFVFPLSVVIGVLILCIIYLPWIAIAIVPLGLIYVSVTSFYQASAREVKRLEAINRSFVYNNFNECLSGVATIKAYQSQDQFLARNDEYLNQMNKASYVNVALQRFLSVQFDSVAVVFILVIGLLCVTRQFNISASSTGLLLSYVLQIVGLLSLLIRSLTQVENEMNSAERLIFYAYELPQEAPYQIEATKPAESWPEHGEIKFENASLRYRDGLPLVLKNLNITVNAGEKIGICGRTGAGKSTIMTALYRLSELAEGKITIDGHDISKLGMFDLRSKLCIIPQDPVLFKGSIRKNLDPFELSDDNSLWDALRRAGLIEQDVLKTVKVQKLDAALGDSGLENLHKFHLDQQVEEEGANFSLGERQLIALARALVRNSKILILDEATSSVDYETDANINKTIRTEFADCTILCIAHRLNTIVKFDRILVMDKGEVAEFGEPEKLYDDNGIFREMCERSAIVRADFIKD
ncbi:ATP-binding cassette transporter [Saccharomycopsis crataegensis]|uniref:ATP-binding cassette transporter n=1 Tax=Saccharomycopsis crataegensis TaxID=43959 RepID=A0AAV5QKR1_9ASCO|nr:ATP-binding cassette transporter [Saccharomycopsis crataegensis]